MKTRTFLRINPIALAAVLALAGPASAAEKKVVVVEKSSKPEDKTAPENNNNLPPGSTAVEASSVKDAVDKIKAQMGKDDCIKDLHFRGHGSNGNQSVGDGVNHRAGERIDGGPDEWKPHLSGLKFCDGATIHLWGCNVGGCDKGASKLKQIADALGVKVRGAVNTVYAGQQESYTGPIQEASPDQPKPEHKAPGVEKAKKKQEEVATEDTGCDNSLRTNGFGQSNRRIDTEDVGCDGLPGTFDPGESDGILNRLGDPARASSCLEGPGEDLGCDNVAGTGDFGEGDGLLNSEDVNGNGFELHKEAVPVDEEARPADKAGSAS